MRTETALKKEYCSGVFEYVHGKAANQNIVHGVACTPN